MELIDNWFDRFLFVYLSSSSYSHDTQREIYNRGGETAAADDHHLDDMLFEPALTLSRLLSEKTVEKCMSIIP